MRLLLNEGQIVFENSSAIETPSRLFLYINSGDTFREVLDQVTDEAISMPIVFEQGDNPVVYVGYTRVIGATDELTGMITITAIK